MDWIQGTPAQDLFSQIELDYLKSQRLARIATVSTTGQPDLVPLEFKFDGLYFWVGSHTNQARKHRNVRDGNKRVAITIDDVQSMKPWKARVIRVYGIAGIVENDEPHGMGKYLRITPTLSWSFGLNTSAGHEHGWAVTRTVHR